LYKIIFSNKLGFILETNLFLYKGGLANKYRHTSLILSSIVLTAELLKKYQTWLEFEGSYEQTSSLASRIVQNWYNWLAITNTLTYYSATITYSCKKYCTGP
jgi:hypothetical protein